MSTAVFSPRAFVGRSARVPSNTASTPASSASCRLAPLANALSLAASLGSTTVVISLSRISCRDSIKTSWAYSSRSLADSKAALYCSRLPV